MRAVTVERVGVDVEGGGAVLILKDTESDRVLPLLIGMGEAAAIAVKLQEQEPPRPLTVDLLRTVLDTFGAKLLMVVLNDLRDHTYYAKIFLRANSKGASTMELDARPSDAIALALRFDAPVYVAEWIMEDAGVIPVEVEEDSEEDDDDEGEPMH